MRRTSLYNKAQYYFDGLKYDEKIDWLYPVYIKLRKELTEFIEGDEKLSTDEDLVDFYEAMNLRDGIEHALISGSISELHSEIVKGITFLNEQKK